MQARDELNLEHNITPNESRILSPLNHRESLLRAGNSNGVLESELRTHVDPETDDEEGASLVLATTENVKCEWSTKRREAVRNDISRH